MEELKIKSIKIERYDPLLHASLIERTFDNTKLVALNTCPTWGIVRYELHKRFPGSRREMALEAGGAAHEAYSAIRLADLIYNGHHFYPDIDCRSVAVETALTLFEESRVDEWLSVLSQGESEEHSAMLAALNIFGTSGFMDDPLDRRRTVANIEEALIAYMQRYPFGKTMPVVLDDFVGVEVPIDMHLIITTDKDEHHFRFIGRVDGVHWRNIDKQTVVIEENKTGARLDDAWEMSFNMSHQVTGYMFAVSHLVGLPVWDGIVRGMAIPLPKTYDYGGINNVHVTRDELKVAEWAEWVLYTHLITKPYLHKPTQAPKFTHSCNRYFRPCAFIPFCDSPLEEREAMLEEMQLDKWSPLDEGHD